MKYYSIDHFLPPYFNTLHTHKLGHNLLLTEARRVDNSKASTRQLAKRNWVSVAAVQVSHWCQLLSREFIPVRLASCLL